MGGKERYDAYRVLVETPEGKRALGRTRRGLDDLHEVGGGHGLD